MVLKSPLQAHAQYAIPRIRYVLFNFKSDADLVSSTFTVALFQALPKSAVFKFPKLCSASKRFKKTSYIKTFRPQLNISMCEAKIQRRQRPLCVQEQLAKMQDRVVSVKTAIYGMDKCKYKNSFALDPEHEMLEAMSPQDASDTLQSF